MIGMDDVSCVAAVYHSILQRIRHRMVVDAPAFVVGPRPGAVTPPTVFGQFGIEVAEGIGEAVVEPVRQPGAFLGQETRSVFVAHGVLDVVFGVGNVVVAADDEVRALFSQLVHVFLKILQKSHLHTLTDFAARSRREVAV